MTPSKYYRIWLPALDCDNDDLSLLGGASLVHILLRNGYEQIDMDNWSKMIGFNCSIKAVYIQSCLIKISKKN